MSTKRLTESDYWESGYVAQGASVPLRIDSFRHMGERRTVEKILSLDLANKTVLEVGAGNSAVLVYLARTHPSASRYAGLDYSESGCRMLAQRAEAEGAKVDVLLQDLFSPEPGLVGKFDVVYSLGVVEHFSNLSEVLRAKQQLLAPNGRMLTVIPNMSGIIGKLTRKWNRSVYDLHVPHDLKSLVLGHRDAGMEIESSGYLCSTNFGVLSSCFTSETDPGWKSYLWLTRVTTALWYLEDKVGDLP